MIQEKFLGQSYEDAWKDYKYSLENQAAPHWDWVLITASNEQQAASYERQIKKRQAENRLPMQTEFAVVADIMGERIGSGGATLNLMRFLFETCGREKMFKQKVLVIHSGGDSKRIPQYSACGKLFSPVPRQLPDGKKVALFDDILMICAGVPSRVGDGILIMPGDTEIVFNPLQIDLRREGGAVGLSVRVDAKEGTEHGVFVANEQNEVIKFLHKQPEEVLRLEGAVDLGEKVELDTGAIWFGERVCNVLFSLVCNNENIFSEKAFCKYVNSEVRLSLYGDFLYPMASASTLDSYQNQMAEGMPSEELTKCRNEIWRNLHDFSMKIVRLVPSAYIHFGTTKEWHELMNGRINEYRYLGWENCLFTNIGNLENGIYNTYIEEGAIIGENACLENSFIGKDAKIGKNSILSSVKLLKGNVPEDVVLNVLKLQNGRYVCRIYGVSDNLKGSAQECFLGASLEMLRKSVNDSFSSSSLWEANLFPVCDTEEEAVQEAFRLYHILYGNDGEIARWGELERISLKDSFNLADVDWLIERQEELTRIVQREKFIEKLSSGLPMLEVLEESGTLAEQTLAEIAEYTKISDFPLNMRLCLALAEYGRKHNICIQGKNSFLWEDAAYEIVAEGIIGNALERHPIDMKKAHFITEEIKVKLPVRVNFCGSPSDAAPYCLEHGGTMLDGTLLLNGEMPICVKVKKTESLDICFESLDLGGKKLITDLQEIRDCRNPDDIFALHKAVLLATGLIPLKGDAITLEEICKNIGGGLYLGTSVDVPKGSGLGTSSILAAACCKAVNTIIGQDISEECLYALVFAVEQLMGTGGGWQDQVGGLTPGLKYFISKPGFYQKIQVEKPCISKETFEELKERFVLVFSGQRRLAKNVLHEEMNQCIRNDRIAIQAVEQIRQFCALMRFYLECGNVTEFAHCITKQFELVKQLDKGASNTCIEYIFDVCGDLIDGKSICGAGGGGFLQMILKKGVKKEELKQKINRQFANCGVEVWDCELV